MPQEKGWYLHGGDIHELWAKVGRRVDDMMAEAEKSPDPPAPEKPLEPPQKP